MLLASNRLTRRARPHIVFSGGGTAGHLFPGLAVAEQLRTALPQARITFCGKGQAFERVHVHRAGYAYHGFPCHALPRTLRGAWRFVRENRRGVRMAMEFVEAESVTLVVGLGGYTSVPMARAAARRRLPLVLLEQNVVPGRATRWLAPSASLVCLSLPGGRQRLRASSPIHVTGNPLRHEVLAAAARRRIAHRPRLVVLGGSRGCDSLNQNAPKALYKLRPWLSDWEIVHQCGDHGCAKTQRLYQKLALSASVTPFIDDLPAVLSSAELAVSRAGGSTLAELAALQVPAVLAPYAKATEDHQRQNACWFAEAGAAVMIDTRAAGDRLDDKLADAMLPLLQDAAARRSLAGALARVARPKAAADVVRLLMSELSCEPHAEAA